MRVHFCLFILSQWGAHWLAQLMILSFSITLFDSFACHGSVRSMPVAFCDIPIILSGLFSLFSKPKRTCSNELMQILSPVGDFYHILRLLNHLSRWSNVNIKLEDWLSNPRTEFSGDNTAILFSIFAIGHLSNVFIYIRLAE